MSESVHHAVLVARIARWVRDRHGAHLGLCLFRDAADAAPGEKPPVIGGYVPDIFARTVPSTVTVIGEAKWFRDVGTDRSRRQLRAYVEHLAAQTTPELVIATPWQLEGTARRLVRRAQAEVRPAREIPTFFLPF